MRTPVNKGEPCVYTISEEIVSKPGKDRRAELFLYDGEKSYPIHEYAKIGDAHRGAKRIAYNLCIPYMGDARTGRSN